MSAAGRGVFPRCHCVVSDAVASFGLWFPCIVHITQFGRQDNALRCFPVCACLLSRVQLSVTPWTVAHQAPLSMGFPRQEHWSGWPFPPPGHLPGPGIEHESMALPGRFFTPEPHGSTVLPGRFFTPEPHGSMALPGRFFTPEPPGKPLLVSYSCSNK